MTRRFTLSGLLLWVTFVAVVLAIVVPLWRAIAHALEDRDVVISLAVSADGSTAAAMIGDGRVLIWDSWGNLKTELEAKGGWSANIELSADGKFAAVSRGARQAGVPQNGGIELWDVVAGKLLQNWPAPFMARAALSPDGKLAAVVALEGIELYSVDDDKPVGTLPGGTLAKFSPDGKTIAVVTPANGVQLYDANTRELVRQLELPPPDGWSRQYFDVAWSDDGRTLCGLCTFMDDAVENVQLWQVDGEGANSIELSNDDSFQTVAYLPGGRRLALAGPSGMKLLDAATLQPLPEEQLEDVAYLASSARGDLVLTGDMTSIDLRDATTLRPRRRLFEGAPPPNILPGLLGMVIWLFVFGVRRVGSLRRSRQNSGQQVYAAHKKDRVSHSPVDHAG